MHRRHEEHQRQYAGERFKQFFAQLLYQAPYSFLLLQPSRPGQEPQPQEQPPFLPRRNAKYAAHATAAITAMSIIQSKSFTASSLRKPEEQADKPHYERDGPCYRALPYDHAYRPFAAQLAPYCGY